MASTTPSDFLPKGGKVCNTFPDLLFLPEFVFGGSVWILLILAKYPLDPWEMFVSVFCFFGTTLWFFIFVCGGNQKSCWPAVDVAFHFLSAVFYLSASIIHVMRFMMTHELSFMGRFSSGVDDPEKMVIASMVHLTYTARKTTRLKTRCPLFIKMILTVCVFTVLFLHFLKF
uniref:MARVEL domain-containing protein n=1 Tax=Oryzias latipes TaxID=8090 RepID=A0A3P9MB28_ORYLA